MLRTTGKVDEVEVEFYKRIQRAALATGLVAAVLLWPEYAVGVSFIVVVLVHLAASWEIVHEEEMRPAWNSLVLLVPILFFAAMTFLRLDPLSRWFSYAATGALLALAANTFVGGRWVEYCFSDYAIGLYTLLKAILLEPLRAWKRGFRHVPGRGTLANWWSRPLVRGAVLSIPFLALFSLTLSASDPVFGRKVHKAVLSLQLDPLPRYALRLAYALVLSYPLFGVYYHTLRNSKDAALVGLEKPGIPRFLGFVEGMTLLGSVTFLMADYLWGRVRRPLPSSGYQIHRFVLNLYLTAAAALVTTMMVSAVVRREEDGERKKFLGLTLAFLGLTAAGVVLALWVTARYVERFGLTRLRFYALLGGLFLIVLLASVALLTVLRKERGFSLAVFLVVLGFGVTVNMAKVDSLIVRWNVARAHAGYELDFRYLASLSDDAAPLLARLYRGEGFAPLADEIAAALSCNAAFHDDYPFDRPWMSFHLSHWRAHVAWEPLRNDPDYALHLPHVSSAGQWVVVVHGEGESCTYGELRNPPHWNPEESWLADR